MWRAGSRLWSAGIDLMALASRLAEGSECVNCHACVTKRSGNGATGVAGDVSISEESEAVLSACVMCESQVSDRNMLSNMFLDVSHARRVSGTHGSLPVPIFDRPGAGFPHPRLRPLHRPPLDLLLLRLRLRLTLPLESLP